MRPVAGWVAGLALVAVIAGCQERLTAPADCPELCPGGNQSVFDTVLPPRDNLDSSIAGYVARGQGLALLVSSGFAASEDRAVYRFVARPDSAELRDTLRAYTVDSVFLSFNLVARDTLVDGLSVIVYRLPATVDSTATFDQIEVQLTDANLIDTIPIPDSVSSGGFRAVLTGSELDRVALPLGTGGVLAVALRITAAAPTGIRLGAITGGNAAQFTSFLTLLDVPDTGSTLHPALVRTTSFNTFVTQTQLIPDDQFLTVGGEPSSRTFLRFDLPTFLEDSATVIRATLELIPTGPIPGLPGDPALLEARAVLADLGAKSPLTTDSRFIVADTLPVGTSDTVRLDLTDIVQLWQASTDRPDAVVLSLLPEAATFTRAVFGSTRSGTVGPPRLRITYLRGFPFENP